MSTLEPARMSTEAFLREVHEAFAKVLPVREGRRQIKLEGVTAPEQDVVVTLQVFTFDPADSDAIVGLFEQELELLPCAAIDRVDPASLAPFVEGCVLAFRALAAREELPAELLPYDFVRGELLLEPSDAEGVCQRTLALFEAAHDELTCEHPRFLEYLQSAEDRHADDAELAARRARALERMREREPAVRARFEQTYGLVLPRTAAVVAAFFDALTPFEQAAFVECGVYRPVGLLEWFEDGGLERKTEGDLDPRLLWRFIRTPIEMVTILLGDSDGEHLGYFYDDPALPPSGVTQSYARDSAETWWLASTPLEALREQIQRRRDDGFEEEQGSLECHYLLLDAAIAAFVEDDRAAYAEDLARGASPLSARSVGAQTMSGVAPRGRDGAAPRADHLRDKPYMLSDALAAVWQEDAQRLLDAGDALEALAIARDLHWGGDPDDGAKTLALLVAAYRALGREALAGIAEVHYAHRTLPSVVSLV